MFTLRSAISCAATAVFPNAVGAHRQEIEEYLKEQETAADAIQEQLESNTDYQAEIAELRSRILDRWTAAQENNDATPIG